MTHASPLSRPSLFPGWRRLLFLAGLVVLALALGCPAAQAQYTQEETSAQALRRELEKYRVLYTEDHPDVQRMKRRLERAEQLEAEQRAEARRKAEARKARQAQAPPNQAPGQTD